ncbi:helix-turn-helix domain-containing protein [Streptomyces sp. NPDC050485]|uniref:helix-turn-helix domain-containing protein n=1 Tax=Streptomyces sp. NPDC050485 TaxID=3365617 RepID=UPI0037A5EE25
MATTESEQFAALLRELKDRSGRSYGVLAGRLHMSTSTLHRYCNGDAVPNEYAPVERLARLCGATPEESVELHRRWILADEARRRSRGANPAAAPTAEAGPASGPAPAEVPAVPRQSEPGPEPEVSEEVELPGVVAADPPAPHRTSRFGGKKVRLALIGAAVVALAVPAVAYASLSGPDGEGGRSGTVADAKQSADAAVKSPAGRTPNGSPSATPSPSASTPSPSASAARSTPSSKLGATGTPVSVGVSSYQWDGPCGKYYLLDQQPGAVPPPPAPQDSRPWARALGGVDAGHFTLELTATGKTQDSVVLTGLHVRVVGREAPLNWTAYSMGSGCGGGVTPQFFDIDLDAAQPRPKPVAGEQGDTKLPAVDFPYKVSSTDPQVLNLDVHTDAHDVTWYLELDWSSGDRSGTIEVKDKGKPFRSAALKGRPAYEYRTDTHVWERLQS